MTALTKLRRLHLLRSRVRGQNSLSLESRKEEKLVLQDRSADGGAELVQAQWRMLTVGRIRVMIGKEGVGIESIVAKILPRAGVQRVGARTS